MSAQVLYELKADLTYADLSARTGIPQISLKRYLKAHGPITVDTFAMIARACDADPLEAFADVEARMQANNN